jgi:tetratricopeptide (TPR) repeat protein
LGLSLGALLCGSVVAEDVGRLLSEGSEQLRRSEWAAAERTFRRALDERGADPDVLALLGIAQYHAESYSEAVESLTAATRGQTRYEARALYYLGLAHSQLEQRDQARVAFEELLRRYPDSVEASQLRRGTPTSGERPWSFMFMQSASRDDNPMRGSRVEDVVLIAPEADNALLTFLSASRRFNHSRFQLDGSVFRNDYTEVDDLDMLGATLAAAGHFNPSARARIRPFIELQHFWLDDAPFEARATVGLEYEQRTGERWSCETLARYSVQRYPEEPFQPLDGDDALLGLGIVRHGRPGSPADSFRFDLSGRHVSADDAFLGYLDAGGLVATRFRLSSGSTLGIATGLFRRVYDETDPTFDVRRDDTRWSSQAHLTVRLVRSLYLRLNATYVDNHSNVDQYLYRQTVWGGALIVMF